MLLSSIDRRYTVDKEETLLLAEARLWYIVITRIKYNSKLILNLCGILEFKRINLRVLESVVKVESLLIVIVWLQDCGKFGPIDKLNFIREAFKDIFFTNDFLLKLLAEL